MFLSYFWWLLQKCERAPDSDMQKLQNGHQGGNTYQGKTNHHVFSNPEREKKKKFRRGKRGGVKSKKRKKELSPLEVEKGTIKIFNLSSHDLNPYEIKLLEKGLSFCPDNKADSFELFLDLHQFTRKLTLKRFFAIQERQNKPHTHNEQGSHNSGIPLEHICKKKEVKSKSAFYPTSSQGNFIETFHDLVASDLEELTK